MPLFAIPAAAGLSAAEGFVCCGAVGADDQRYMAKPAIKIRNIIQNAFFIFRIYMPFRASLVEAVKGRY